MNLDELKEAANIAGSNFYRIDVKINNEVQKKEIEMRRAMHDELDALKDSLKRQEGWQKALNEKIVAEKELEAEKDRIARIGDGGAYPVGTKLYEWGPVRKFSRDIGATGKVGIFECITKDSVHAGNVAGYSRASIGDFVVRELKKDGTPSSRYHRYKHWMQWYPEGESPTNNTRKEKP